MAPYDSDSSGGEDDYTETNVLLAYASKEASDDTISQLGGIPTWLDPTTPPSASLAKCRICKDFMVLLLQLHGDLPDFKGHERRLYVWTCRRKICRRKEGSVRALRATRITEVAQRKRDIKKEEPKEGPKPPQGSGSGPANPFSSGASNPFLSSGNPFASSGKFSNPFSTAVAAAGLPSTTELAAKPPQNPSPISPTTIPFDLPKSFAAALSLNNDQKQFGPPPPPEPWPQESELPAPYPTYYFVDHEYETLDKAEDIPIPTVTMDLDEGSGSRGGKEDKDVYEDTIDKTFQRFADRLAQNPEQAIRYEFKGQPLLYSKSDAVGKLLGHAKGNENKVSTSNGSESNIPRCGNCGAGRVFEVQLCPHAIIELEREESGLDGMEWGTVIVGVCEMDCVPNWVKGGEVGYVEEWCGVQWEELK